MVLVQVKALSSSSCTLAQASALLERFSSSSACSDSFAADYVATVARALRDSISRRAEGPERISSELPLRSSAQFIDLKQGVSVGGNCRPSSVSATAEDVEQDAVGALQSHKTKRRHSDVEYGLGIVLPSASEMEGSAYTHHERKRRKKEKHEKEREDYSLVDQETRKRKEEQEIGTQNVTTDYPDPDNLHGSKRRKKEKQGRYTEGMKFSDNKDFPVPLLVDENLEKKSASKAKKKVEAGNNVEVSVMCLPSKLEQQAGSINKKRKEYKASPLTTPSKVTVFEKNRDETVSPLEFENFASRESKKTKKKRRKEQLSESVRQSWSG